MVLPLLHGEGRARRHRFPGCAARPDRLRPRIAAQGLLHQLVARARRALGQGLSARAGQSRRQCRRQRIPVHALVRSHRRAASHQGAGHLLPTVASRRQDRISRRSAAHLRLRARRLPPLSRAGGVRALAGMAHRAAACRCQCPGDAARTGAGRDSAASQGEACPQDPCGAQAREAAQASETPQGSQSAQACEAAEGKGKDKVSATRAPGAQERQTQGHLAQSRTGEAQAFACPTCRQTPQCTAQTPRRTA